MMYSRHPALIFFLTACFSPISLVKAQSDAQRPIADFQATSSAASALSLNFTSSSPHIFSSVRSLLQQWPNTFFPNGHSIVPCEVPPYTNLYHGRPDDEIPPSPEWFAFDIEMAYGIMGSLRNIHMLSYQTVKPVKCLYFDGMSAALMGEGQLDSQMVFLYGNVSGPPTDGHWGGLGAEYARARGLCRWVEENGVGGVGWGIEGIVRMNAGFELIWCNFTSPSIRLVSHLNLTAPLLPDDGSDDVASSPVMLQEELVKRGMAPSKSLFPLPSATSRYDEATSPAQPPLPPNWRNIQGREPFLRTQAFEWFRSATWHYGASGIGPGIGETKVKLLTCGFLSFYDDEFESQASARAVQEQTHLNLTGDGKWLGPGLKGNRTKALQELTRRRRYHTLGSIEAADAALMNNATFRVVRSLSTSRHSIDDTQCTGIDWTALTTEIVTRYSTPLTQLFRWISSANPASLNETTTERFLAGARDFSHGLLVPFLQYPKSAFNEAELNASEWTLESDLGQQTFSRCKYAYTRLLYNDDNNDGQLLRSIPQEETKLIAALEDVMSAICSTVIKVGFDIEYTWLSTFNLAAAATATNPKPTTTTNSNSNPPKTSTPQPNLLLLSSTQLTHWTTPLEDLTAWLGWASDQVRCEKVCSKDQTCYIPMWPMLFLPPGSSTPPRRGGPYNGTRPGYGYGGGDGRRRGRRPPPGWGLEDDLWEPRCVERELLPRFEGSGMG